jgi:ribosome-associated protein
MVVSGGAMIRINDRVSIPEDELAFAASRSGGPGGQHVNKVSSRVTLRFDLDGSPSLTESQKHRIRRRLATRVSNDGVLRVVCQRHRSQIANRREVVERFAELLRKALKRPRRRRKTRVPAESKRLRLEDKRRRGELKRRRSRADIERE